jgi:hypothetical protein
MYQVSLVAPSGKSFEINNPLDYNGSYNAGGKVSFEESREYDVPLELKKDLEPGSYKMIAKQRIYIFRKPNRQDVQQGELVSNLLEVQVK